VIVEEALKSGIEKICLVVQQGEREVFEGFLSTPESPMHHDKLPIHLREYSGYLREIGERVSFVEQESQEGFGHAVFAAREWVGEEPFLLMLGDHLYTSNDDVPCARQLLDVYDQHQTSVVGVMRTEASLIDQFGAVGGRWINDAKQRLLTVDQFVEKPTIEFARSHLQINDCSENEFLTLFGQYVLSSKVFELLGEAIAGNQREQGEFQLTSTLDRLRQEDGFLGYETRGRRFDVGMPTAYLETLKTYPG